MPNSRHTSVMASPSNRRATKRRRSSITELAFHGIYTSRRTKAESVTHVSGTFCHLCLGPLTLPASFGSASRDVIPGQERVANPHHPPAKSLGVVCVLFFFASVQAANPRRT